MTEDPRALDAEEFLDRTFERAIALLEQGTIPTVGELLQGREDLRREVEELVRVAELVMLVSWSRFPRSPSRPGPGGPPRMPPFEGELPR